MGDDALIAPIGATALEKGGLIGEEERMNGNMGFRYEEELPFTMPWNYTTTLCSFAPSTLPDQCYIKQCVMI